MSTTPVPERAPEFDPASHLPTAHGRAGGVGAFPSLCRVPHQAGGRHFGYRSCSLKVAVADAGGWVGSIRGSRDRDVERSNSHRPAWFLSQLSFLIVPWGKLLFASYSLSFLPFSSPLFIPALFITFHQCHRKLLNCMQIRTQNLHLAE